MTERVRYRIAAGLVALAALLWAFDGRSKKPDVPPPPEVLPLTLRGLFIGPTAAEDSTILAGLSGEIADEIEWDGQQSKPMYTNGLQLDELRTRARAMRCRGERIGDRQPKVRDAVHAYLDDAVGVSGGPITPEQRHKWVEAYRVIEKAASDATK